jgi:hypothetical protein
MPDVRTYVMIVVEASWAADDGVMQTVSARMEDKSTGGACIRVKKPIPTGSKISIQWRFEQFSGIVKYCRSDGYDYLIGIQRDVSASTPKPPTMEVSQEASSRPAAIAEKEPAKKSDPVILIAPAHSPKQEAITNKIAAHNAQIAAAVRSAVHETITRRRFSRELATRSHLTLSYRQEPNAPQHPARKDPLLKEALTDKETEPQLESPKQNEAETKRIFMGHKWLDKAPWHHKRDESNPGGPEQSNAHSNTSSNGYSAKENSMSFSTPSPEKNAAHTAREVPTFQAELLPMEEIYVAAGIPAARKGYSVKKIVEMLNNDHIRNLSSELKRASILMALDCAGVPMDQIQRDAKARHDALNAYEAEQKKQAEADWARKAEEIAHIQSELESIKTHYMARINRNLEAVARDKTRFTNWQTTKQEEAQSMTEALDLCLKSHATEPPSPPHPETSMASAIAASAATAQKP